MSHSPKKQARDAKRAQADEPYCCDQQNGPDDESLLAYGYAPGDYMVRCSYCQQVVSGVDKRAVTCRPCAVARRDSSDDEPSSRDQENGPDDALHDGQPWRMPAEPFNWPALPVQPGTVEAIHADKDRWGRCRKCGWKMQEGTALFDRVSGAPDFPGGDVVTVSPDGTADLVPCSKCRECGWSVT